MTINCKGKLIDLSTPKVMGILNVTPDSFFDGGRYKDENSILNQVENMLNQGATFIDIGAYSSRPNADFVTENEELQRIVPIVELLVKYFPEIIISVDTFRSEVAKQTIKAGASLINDISAGFLDEKMLQTVANLSVPYIMMHMRGTPQTMQTLTDYDNLTKDVNFYFSERISKARALGIIDLILDPGFGFAKTTQQNFELLNQLELLNIADLPLLVGVSRKSMIYKTLDTTAQNALNGTTALHMIALQKGAKILRVHDVKEAKECITLYNQLHA
ncbi:dihydropteroate synthase [Mesoflavibacter sabulilitoris]|uniref:Dihydropteroate synthase n=1 Tax=Mesoflavibacter zeaxanthinifaciens subsp. sabulilitoris TaxID=1520893 RepID=A0A2T1NAA4_9FLAO|nr:dihydropteroate synthase [Mesoflavibacter zeaxanthinifaciens]MBB3123805.1 dihydropteroate synthase [Mesoflavibacter zeaxanthinifaciens subsp. sabulilitoris]PSG89077.1 dihydropteroate synthase [Mesoflavibacter zeaxanthinifaciens subsp. sabulilitoris]